MNNTLCGPGAAWPTSGVTLTASNDYRESAYNNSPRLANPQVNVVDLQRLVNTVLGIANAGNGDLNRDGAINVLDVQILVNVILGIATCP